ncbi:shikimate kinase [Spirochaeta isovalerica]|uniref:Shikimate kinase n=1 Tax=Spirochaeta isovalerica TaxID=150 RepID=A0A841RDH8_9SPIO|nr:shikimate kinase [Spirochaeta isovalerica]MBB6481441.1 shikimate kinase [Spirochaeta isovalerica]
MKKNITLIGMPGAGKSTTGIILAKNLSMGFLDTDILIQINRGESLQSIMDRDGYMALRQIEEEEILKINIEGHVIATGGSAVYSEAAMKHLGTISRIIFLQAGLAELKARIRNFETRGIAKAGNQSFAELFSEREVLYRRYADIVVDTAFVSQDETALLLEKKLKELD